MIDLPEHGRIEFRGWLLRESTMGSYSRRVPVQRVASNALNPGR